MIGKVEILKTLTQKVHRKSDDSKTGGDSSKKRKSSSDEERNDKSLNGSMSLDELKEIVVKLNGYEHYRTQNISFVIIQDEETMHVNVLAKDGRVIQHLSTFAAKELALRLSKVEETPVKGGLLNISC